MNSKDMQREEGTEDRETSATKFYQNGAVSNQLTDVGRGEGRVYWVASEFVDILKKYSVPTIV
jgi:hypothetical protein